MAKKLFMGIDVQGWASLMVAVLMSGGLLLFSMGIIGEYLIRVIESSEGKPTYIIRHCKGGGAEFSTRL